jgi:hypothetical protein
MRVCFSLAGAFLTAVLSSAAAQEPSGRLDLDLMAALPRSELVAARIVFTKSNAKCPEDQGIVNAADGLLTFHRASVFQRALQTMETFRPIEDDAYRSRIAGSDCRVDLIVRQQLRGDSGSWTSLLLPARRRPSLSPEEQKEAQRQFAESLSNRPHPVSPEDFGRYRDARGARATMRSLGQGVPFTMNVPVQFEGAPAACVEALGDYLIDPDGITFLFVTRLPGGINRFQMERVDSSDDHARLYLTRGDCRYEITIAASVLHDGQWIARAIAPYVPSNTRILIRRDPGSRPPWLDRSE